MAAVGLARARGRGRGKPRPRPACGRGGDEASALSHLADAITRSRPQRGGHLWSHVWALTQAVPLARRAADPRAQPWHDEALTTAQRSGMRSLEGDLRQLG